MKAHTQVSVKRFLLSMDSEAQTTGMTKQLNKQLNDTLIFLLLAIKLTTQSTQEVKNSPSQGLLQAFYLASDDHLTGLAPG